MKNDRKVKLTDSAGTYIIKIPTVDGPNALYELVAAIEHVGSALTGHYVSHLRHNDEFWLANDANPLSRSSQNPEFDVEKSTIFLYKKLNYVYYD